MKQLIFILTFLTIVSCNYNKEIDTDKLIENKNVPALEQKRYELVIIDCFKAENRKLAKNIMLSYLSNQSEDNL